MFIGDLESWLEAAPSQPDTGRGQSVAPGAQAAAPQDPGPARTHPRALCAAGDTAVPGPRAGAGKEPWQEEGTAGVPLPGWEQAGGGRQRHQAKQPSTNEQQVLLRTRHGHTWGGGGSAFQQISPFLLPALSRERARRCTHAEHDSTFVWKGGTRTRGLAAAQAPLPEATVRPSGSGAGGVSPLRCRDGTQLQCVLEPPRPRGDSRVHPGLVCVGGRRLQLWPPNAGRSREPRAPPAPPPLRGARVPWDVSKAAGAPGARG